MILSRLKERTSSLHEKIERTVDLPGRLQSLDSYSKLLARFYGFYRPLEQSLISLNGFSGLGLDLEGRLKTRFLVADLHSLGFSERSLGELPMCAKIPYVSDLPDALGCLYVLEGATLGGQIVRKQVRELHGLGATTGCSFFSSYGDQIRQMWSEFCQVLTIYDVKHPEHAEQILATAEETFGRLEEWLSC